MSASHDGWRRKGRRPCAAGGACAGASSPPSAPAGGILVYASQSTPFTPTHLGATPGPRWDGSPDEPSLQLLCPLRQKEQHTISRGDHDSTVRGLVHPTLLCANFAAWPCIPCSRAPVQPCTLCCPFPSLPSLWSSAHFVRTCVPKHIVLAHKYKSLAHAHAKLLRPRSSTLRFSPRRWRVEGSSPLR